MIVYATGLCECSATALQSQHAFVYIINPIGLDCDAISWELDGTVSTLWSATLSDAWVASFLIGLTVNRVDYRRLPVASQLCKTDVPNLFYALHTWEMFKMAGRLRSLRPLFFFHSFAIFLLSFIFKAIVGDPGTEQNIWCLRCSSDPMRNICHKIASVWFKKKIIWIIISSVVFIVRFVLLVFLSICFKNSVKRHPK